MTVPVDESQCPHIGIVEGRQFVKTLAEDRNIPQGIQEVDSTSKTASSSWGP